MCSGISLLVGLFLIFRGNFRVFNRNVPRQTGRLIGLILIAPIIIGFFYGVFVVGSSRGTLTNDMLLNAALVEIGALAVAIVVALYFIMSLPQEAPIIPVHVAQSVSPSVMTPAEAAAYLKTSEFEVIALIEEGKLPAARIGGDYRIARSAVDDFLRSQGEAEKG